MNGFAAHIRIHNEKEEVQTVQEHCRNAEILAENYAGVFHAPGIAGLQALVHDCGKLCDDFNDYIHGMNDYKRGMIDHCYAGARYLRDFAGRTRDPKLMETADFIARTVISHHGLHDWIDENGEDYFLRRISKEERYREIEANFHSMVPDEKLFLHLQEAGKEYEQIRSRIRRMSMEQGREKEEKQKLFAFYMGQLERLMQSVLIDADRTDTAAFQTGSEKELAFSGDIWEAFSEKMEKKCREFEKRTDRISKIRSDISQRCLDFSENKTGICRLIVPTGGGKTLASLRFAVHYCKKQKKERIFYIAPFQSILEQNSDVWKTILGEEYLLEHYSDIAAGLETDEEIEEYELRSEKWDMPVITTTMVQFLNTLFLNRLDSVRRMHRLCNSVIIIDEVQSVPTKCVSLFNLAMNFLSEIGESCIVLCSATQPTFEKTKYPLRIDERQSMTGDYTGDFLALKRNEIISMVRPGGYTYEEAADFCVGRYREEGNLLFVVNTKTAAYSLYKRLKMITAGDTAVIHISTNMCPEHRREVIKKLKEMLYSRQKVICVTTQLIEAGVDISFPCVIRSLAGLDNAAQAAGRCNRSGEYGQCCHVYLLNLNEERLGNLKEIRTEQNISGQMIQSGGYSDLQSVEAMSDYFEKYYQEQKEELEYNVEDIGIQTDLLELLSVNRQRSSPEINRNRRFYTGQAFRSAGEKFRVIDDCSISVVVPYNEEAVRMIADLRSDIRLDEQTKVLRKIQKYTVGIYEHTERKLKEKRALDMLNCGVYVLDERYYDDEAGILIEGKPMDLLMF